MLTNEEYKTHCIGPAIIFHYHATALALSEYLIPMLKFTRTDEDSVSGRQDPKLGIWT